MKKSNVQNVIVQKVCKNTYSKTLSVHVCLYMGFTSRDPHGNYGCLLGEDSHTGDKGRRKSSHNLAFLSPVGAYYSLKN
jgi:hypothetical protein